MEQIVEEYGISVVLFCIGLAVVLALKAMLYYW